LEEKKKVDREFWDEDRRIEGRKAEKTVLTDEERENIFKEGKDFSRVEKKEKK